MTRREEIADAIVGSIGSLEEALLCADAILALPPLPVEPGELVKRLSLLAEGHPKGYATMQDAAATITAQAAEIERMAAEAKRLNDVWARPTAQLLEDERKAAECDTATARAETAERKLAEARKVLVEAMTKVENDRTLYTREWQMWLADARAALTEQDQDHG